MNVLLLRAPTDPTDPYESRLSEAGLHAVNVPVLETGLLGHAELQKIVDNQGKDFDGVIITSARACEAWKATAVSHWNEIPFYVPGSATAAAVRSIYPSQDLDIRGEDTGTSENLARFILQDMGPGNLLYLTGDKNRDILPNILTEGGMQLYSIQVYETRGSRTFGTDLKRAISDGNEKVTEWWIVFFSPSSAQFVLPHLEQHFNLSSTTLQDKMLARILAIGPTTSAFLHDTLHLKVDAVATKPSPEGVVTAIEAQMGLESTDRHAP
ncbi:tetrapyrrole biosynthesis, uroporphyrinogen III synthase [Mycena floridula]|nr:tetrapyrrole biosynthesis, uroporphyrinogen III synthase [Mycena floridula]